MNATAATGRSSGAGLSLRPVEPEDIDFLFSVYASTREEELAPLAWSRAEKDKFLHMQFQAQHRCYQEEFPGAAFDLVLLEGQPIGRLYVARGQDEIRIIDIALLPEHRGSGIGTRLLQGLLAEAARGRQVVRLHVEQFNPALRLYERLGFRRGSAQGIYLPLEWVPE